MKTLLALLVICTGFAFAQEGNRCYFVGIVDWEGEIDYAVVKLTSRGYVFEDSVHFAEPDGYSFGWYSNYTVEDREPWKVECWLVLDDQIVSIIQSYALIMFPDDFESESGVYYHRGSFIWGSDWRFAIIDECSLRLGQRSCISSKA